MDGSFKNSDEELGEWLRSDFGAAHATLPDVEQWLGIPSEYTWDPEKLTSRKKSDEEWEQHDREFTMHALDMALFRKQPDYQYLVALALTEGHWGLSPHELLQHAADAGRSQAQKALDKLRGGASAGDTKSAADSTDQ